MIGSDPLSRVTAALADRYVVEREIGRGGMATVYLARDRVHARPVAIKVLRPELDAAVGPERFLREIGIVARLTHPNILPILDSGSTDGLLYYVMPYVAGESLRARLQREGALPLGDALRIGEQLLEALDHAHVSGVMHRDVKPENVLLSHGQALLADFGIARGMDDAAAERLTATGMSIGTPAYMSPEQAAGSRTVDARSDLYSAACVIYEMLAGEPPFTGPTPQAILARRLSQAVPSLGIVRDNLPGGIEPALVRALARAPADRFASAADFATALRSGEVAARRRPWRRRAGVVAGVTLVLAAAAFGASRMRGRAATADTPPAGSADRLRLAVLPFGTLGPDTAAAYLGAGLGEDISAALSATPDLVVVARSASAAVAGDRDPLAAAGRTLRVGSVVQGSVQRDGPRLRISVQLIDVASRATLWSETYDRRTDDILAMQQDVAAKVRDALHARLAGPGRSASAPPTRNAAAYDAYLRALYFGDRDEPDSAEAALRLAVAHDSTFALAWGELALVEQGLFFNRSTDRKVEQAAYVAAERALALSPDQPQAIVARASLLWTLPNGFQHQRVAQEYRRAIRISPNAVDPHKQLGSLFMHVGLLDEALAQFDTVLALDPVNTFVALRIPRIRWYQGKYQQALDQWGNDDISGERASVLAALGRGAEALALLDTMSTLPRSDNQAVRAAVLASLGRRPEAERAIALAIRAGEGTSHFHHAAEHIAAAYAQLGDSAAAVAWLRRTARDGMPCYTLFLNDRRLDPVRGYGPFVAFMAEQKRQWEYFRRTL